MAVYSRLTGGGWRNGDDSTVQSRVGSNGWYQTGELSVDVVAPVISSIDLIATSATELTGYITTTESGPCWAVLYLAGLSAPSALQIKAGTDVNGAPAIQHINWQDLEPGVNEILFTSAIGGTAYRFSAVQDDLAMPANESNVLSSDSETTPTPDLVAPLLDNELASVLSSFSLTLSVETDEANGVMYVVITDSATPPTEDQIILGQNHLGVAAEWADSQSVSSVGTKLFNVTGLSELTGYYPYIFQRDQAGNDSIISALGLVTTFRNGAFGQEIIDTTGPVGGNPAGILYNKVVLPEDANKWFSFTNTTAPSSGVLTINPNGTFTFVGPNPEIASFQLEVNNVPTGSPWFVTFYDQLSYKVLKYWNGSAWVAKVLKYWNGSAWVAKVLKYWNGSAWA